MPVLLTERDVRAVLPMPDLIEAMSGALAEYSARRVVQPVRTVLEVGSGAGFFAVMPAALDDPPVMGAKLVTVYNENHHRGLPSHLATIVVLDHATGELVALMDGRYITEARTAAVSAVSVKLLARPNARSLAIIGSGVQARSHLEAIRHVRALSEVRVWSPTARHREAFAAEMSSATGLPVRASASASEAARDADIVVLATASVSPVVEDDAISAGAHICGVGACRPDQREMPTAIVARSRIFVDSRAGALKEAGDILLPIRERAIDETHIAGELGELALGRVAGRQSDADLTIFKSLGMAVEDVVTARLVVERAKAAGLGQTFELT
ncbi:MAG TPA: ornithine cyclodeaminase family protein [Vicinamibacterales bacterium]|nr:ornithine cyclodeaminase family protein [Vicinamibacterales bacterium]